MSADFTPEKEDYKILTPFKMQVLTNFPYIEADFDALTNYQLLCKVVEYLNEVISNENEVTAQVTSLYNAYVSLQNYVNDYFDNLDVQEEINNKLDKMAEDGSLTNLIKNYVDPYIDAQDQEISTFKSYINGTVDTINNKVTEIANATPLTASSTAGMTDTSRIYVNTTDGKWYYYDGDSWEIGGTYQASAIGENTIGFNNLTGEFKNDLNNRTYNSEELNYKDIVINLASYGNWVNKNVNDSTGEIGSSSTSAFTNEKLIYIPNNAIINIEFLNSYSVDYYQIYQYDENKNYLGFSARFERINPTNLKCSYIRLKFIKSNIDPSGIENVRLTLSSTYSKNIVYVNSNIYLINPETVLKNKYINPSAHNIGTSTTYSLTDFIPVTEGNYTTKCRIRMYLLYTSTKTEVANSFTENVDADSTIAIPEGASYIRLVYYNADSNIMFYAGTESTDYIPFKKELEYAAALSTTMKSEIADIVGQINSNNVLTGKKLVTCGDSFTQYTNATFDGGIYDGYNKVWPYLIGLRNNMTVHNMAVSGGTMATGDFVAANKFSAGLYQEIDADADYIILKYGINDNNNNVPIGTINDNSTSTFYGAWNTVMSYIIENHPTAKIGIIVTNGLVIHENEPHKSNYANAIINIAAKYGIPTLNEWDDPNVPLLIRTGRTDVDETIRNERAATFRVNQYNTHENYVCHAYESTFIEDFLRRL